MRRLDFAALSLSVLISACDSDGGPTPKTPDASVDAAPPPSEGGKLPSDATTTPDVSVMPDALPPPHEGEAAVEAGTDAAPDAAEAGPFPPTAYPRLLSQTGLFADIEKETLGDGVRPFQPRYVLWSDGATKRRWLYLPAGAKIDTSDMDYWTYPVGTTAWKEFTRNKVRVETRMLRKTGPNPTDWTMIAYQWRTDQRDAVAVPDGVPNANGTPHDIPSHDNCVFCHKNMKDVLLGVSAVQLSHGDDGVGFRIDDLIAEGRLSAPPAEPLRVPGDSVAESALGYLHANCGLCHNGQSGVARTTKLRLWETADHLDAVEHTTAYETTVGRPNAFLPDLHIIEPGRPDESELVIRISERGIRQMPPIATEVVDQDGVAKIRAWVTSLPRPQPDGGVGDAGPAVLDSRAPPRADDRRIR